MRFITLVSILLIMSCNGQKKTVTVPEEEKTTSSDSLLSLVVSDNYSGANVVETLVINDAKSLQKFYAKINRTRKPGLPVPDIDFAKETIVVYCSGEKNDFSVPKLTTMENRDEKLVIGVKHIPQDSTTSIITTPFSVYKMPSTQKEVIFKKAR